MFINTGRNVSYDLGRCIQRLISGTVTKQKACIISLSKNNYTFSLGDNGVTSKVDRNNKCEFSTREGTL